MKQYKVTLNLTFQREYGEADEYLEELERKEYDMEDEGSDNGSDDGSDTDSVDSEIKHQAEAFRRTDAYYAEHSIEEHIKSNDALGFVEFICCDGEVVSAEWDKEKFQIHCVIQTDLSPKKLVKELRDNSLEDGEYEACGDTGWIVMTRGPNNEVFGRPWDLKNYWAYGLTDYRRNPIVVEEIKAA